MSLRFGGYMVYTDPSQDIFHAKLEVFRDGAREKYAAKFTEELLLEDPGIIEKARQNTMDALLERPLSHPEIGVMCRKPEGAETQCLSRVYA